ncbi:MAG: hypothetical protein Tsb009_20360 [Planctomycetaceae bacterium]
MYLERDEFVVEYDRSQLSTEDLTTTVKEAGFSGRVVADSETLKKLPTKPVVSDDPLYVTALKRAKKEGKPIVIDFSATWCAPCKKMERLTFPDSKVAPLLKKTVFLKVDTDQHEELTQAFGVVGLPDIWFLSSDGTPLSRLTDYQDAATFAKALQKILSPKQ